ncbi:hypothetical protein LTR10_004907 [Elasticomyces elasticus]|nr:hypothetical protein LTR10_004907 [Elasticomyces elasticus]KAK4977222.1 hypothetical protein LTR42_003270 [Elasticomyces elasticus]
MTATYSNPVDYLDHFLLSATLLWLAMDAYGWYNLTSRPSPFLFALDFMIIPLLAMVGISMRRDWRRWYVFLRARRLARDSPV